MTETDSAADGALGPVDFLAVEFPDGIPTAGGFNRLLDLVDRRAIQILDVEFLRRNAEGVHVVQIEDLPAVEGLDLSVWQGSSSRLLDLDDQELIGQSMAEGSLVVVVVFENLWVIDLVNQWTAQGARLIADGAIPAEDLLTALDADEAN